MHRNWYQEIKHLVLSSLCNIISLECIQSITRSIDRKDRSKHTLVNIRLSLMRSLIELVSNSILSSGSAGAQAGIIVLGDRLVGLLGCLSTASLDRLGNVVGSVLSTTISKLLPVF